MAGRVEKELAESDVAEAALIYLFFRRLEPVNKMFLSLSSVPPLSSFYPSSAREPVHVSINSFPLKKRAANNSQSLDIDQPKFACV